jgi:glycosyltransferase involved in cell wall biosynthesis
VERSYGFACTVMTPTFNRAHTLPRAYTSLEEQTRRDFEWVIIDDGSTDGTPRLVEGWSITSSFPIRYVRQANLGKHVARNHAVAMASGRFFLGLDSDDWLLPHALHRLLDVWETIPVERRPGFLGVAGRCSRPDGTKIGPDLPAPFVDSDEIELRGRYRIDGDNAGMNRLDVLREFPLPEIEGDAFAPEAIVQNRVALLYKTRYFDEVLEVRDYQAGGLTDRSRIIRMQSPSSSLVYYGELLAVPERLGRRAYLRASANFARYALHAGRPIWRTRSENNILTWLAALPVAVWLWAGDQRAVRAAPPTTSTRDH